MSAPEHHQAQAALALILATASDTPTVPADDGQPAVVPAQAALTALIALRHLRDQLDGCEPQLIAAARAAGASWAELAPAMGVTSRQAAERRYLRIRRGAQDDATATGDQRVTAERDRRAGTKAVTGWARDNSAGLRRLAGQITALTDLGPHAQASLDRLHHALGGDDPATLLPLLSDVHEYLQSQHGALADQVTGVTDDADQVRRTTQSRREHQRRTSD